MRCNYNLDTQQSEITSTTTYVPGGGGVYCRFGHPIYRSATEGGGDGAAGLGVGRDISIIYKVFFFSFFPYIITIRVFFSCAFECV